MQQIGQEPNWSPSSMTPVRAAKELLKRTEATENLIAFTEYTFDRYRTAPHHRLIAQHLERVEHGEIDRLMLLVPPRHGKSELASKRFPAFYLGRHPHRQFISVSATAELAADFGRDVRNLIESAECFGERTVLSSAVWDTCVQLARRLRRACARPRGAGRAD